MWRPALFLGFQELRLKVSPKISNDLASTQVGPGSYFGQQKLPTHNKKKSQRTSNWGNDGRFNNFEAKQNIEADLPGPGTYHEQNGWNIRTYNLKFLHLPSSVQQIHHNSTINKGSDKSPKDLDIFSIGFSKDSASRS